MIGRAGTGVDNVDVEAATKRGIVVANAPEANAIAAAEHTMALIARPLQEHPAGPRLSDRRANWERSRFAGTELYGKTLGVLGFGRIGQLVASRAQGFEMQVVAYDKFVTAERFRELGVEGVDDPRSSTRARTSSPCTFRRPPRRSNSSTPRRSRGCARVSGSSTAPAASSSTSTR